jgi:hypothetical protein
MFERRASTVSSNGSPARPSGFEVGPGGLCVNESVGIFSETFQQLSYFFETFVRFAARVPLRGFSASGASGATP